MRKEIVVLLGLFSILIIMLVFNDILTFIGINELRYTLSQQNKENSNNDFLCILEKYEKQKQLYKKIINEDEASISELKLNSLLIYYEKKDRKDNGIYKAILPPFLAIVNLFRNICGLGSLPKNFKDVAREYLKIAYYYENNKSYNKALLIYDELINIIKQDNINLPIIQIHRGFCHSIIGNHLKAKQIYRAIIDKNKNENITNIARQLFKILEDISIEINIVKKSKENSIIKAEKFFQLMAYDEAINLLNQSKPQFEEEQIKIDYFMARSLEEQGNIDKALPIFKQIISKNPQSEFAKKANHRVLFISYMNRENKYLKNLANDNQKIINSKEYPVFTESLDWATRNYNYMSIDEIIEDSAFFDEEISEQLKIITDSNK